MPDGNEAAKELERCMRQLGFKGVEILTNVAGYERRTRPGMERSDRIANGDLQTGAVAKPDRIVRMLMAACALGREAVVQRILTAHLVPIM